MAKNTWTVRRHAQSEAVRHYDWRQGRSPVSDPSGSDENDGVLSAGVSNFVQTSLVKERILHR